jgi:ribosome-associated heat shock protein Hsp15
MSGKAQQKSHTPKRKGQEIEGLDVRLDKWLWAVRFCKTRAIARDLVASGKVHYNQQRAKPSRIVEIGAMIKVPIGPDEKVVEVLGLENNRQSAVKAQLLYCETDASLAQREKNTQARKLSAFYSPKPDSRPDKKQRREIIKFKHQ